MSPISNINNTNNELTPPQKLQKFLKYSGIFFLAAPFMRTVLPWKRLPMIALGAYGTAIVASHIWVSRHKKD